MQRGGSRRLRRSNAAFPIAQCGACPYRIAHEVKVCKQGRARSPRRSLLETADFYFYSKELFMKKQVPHDKYFLRSLHQEIDFYDRKLVYLDKHMQFASTADRKEAEGRLISKRSTLAQTAKQLVAEGVEFNPADLPRSFRASENAVADH